MSGDISGKGRPVFLAVVTKAMQHTRRDIVLCVGDIEHIGCRQEAVRVLERRDIYRLVLLGVVDGGESAEGVGVSIHHVRHRAKNGKVTNLHRQMLESSAMVQDYHVFIRTYP